MTETEKQGVPAVGFLVLAFTDEKAGDQTLQAMKEAKKQKQFYFENAAVIRQDTAGKVHYSETGDMNPGKGAGVGALVGGIIGVLGGPAGVALGATAGAALGAAVSTHDAGFRNESLKTMGLALKPGTSAVAAITSSAFLKALQQHVPIEDTRRFVQNLSAEISSKLDQGKSVALGILLTADGLSMKEVAVNEKSAEVFALVVTDEAVLAASAVATADQLDYQMTGATQDGAFVEAGIVTKDGALIVNDVITAEGETVTMTAIIPEKEAKEQIASGEEKPAEAGDTEEKPTEA